MNSTEKEELYKKLDRAYERASGLRFSAKILRDANARQGCFDQKPDEPPMSVWAKAKATGAWLRNASAFGAIGFANGMIWTQDSAMTWGYCGLAIGAVLAPDNRGKHLGLHFLTHGFVAAVHHAMHGTSKLMHAWAAHQDPRAPFKDGHGQTIIPPRSPRVWTAVEDPPAPYRDGYGQVIIPPEVEIPFEMMDITPR